MGEQPICIIFSYMQSSTVILIFFILNNIYSLFRVKGLFSFFECRYFFLFSSAGLPCLICVGAILLLLKLFAFLFSRKRFFGATTFSPRFCVLNKNFATTGVRTQEDYFSFYLMSNALTIRP